MRHFDFAAAKQGVPVKTVLGHVPRIQTFHCDYPAYPILGVVENSFGMELMVRWTVSGHANLGDMFDLVEAPEINLKELQ